MANDYAKNFLSEDDGDGAGVGAAALEPTDALSQLLKSSPTPITAESMAAILDAPNLLAEYRSRRADVMQFLGSEAILQQLIATVALATAPEAKVGQAWSAAQVQTRQRAHTASGILATPLGIVHEHLMNSSALLATMLDLAKRASARIRHAAAQSIGSVDLTNEHWCLDWFAKCVTALVKAESVAAVVALFRANTFFPPLFDAVHNDSIFELLQLLLWFNRDQSDSVYPAQVLLSETSALNFFRTAVSTSAEPSLARNGARALVDIIARTPLVLPIASDAKAAELATTGIHPVMAALFEAATVQALTVGLASKQAHNFEHSLSVLIALLTRTVEFDGKKACESLAAPTVALVATQLPHIVQAGLVTLSSSTDKAMPMPWGTLKPPLTPLRLKVVQFIVAAVTCRDAKVHSAVANANVFPMILNLFFHYHQHSILHALTSRIVDAVLASSSPVLWRALLIDAKLVPAVVEAFVKGSQLPSGERPGNLGHLLRIQNSVSLALAGSTPAATKLQAVFADYPDADRARWQSHVTGLLAAANLKHNIDLYPDRPITCTTATAESIRSPGSGSSTGSVATENDGHTGGWKDAVEDDFDKKSRAAAAAATLAAVSAALSQQHSIRLAVADANVKAAATTTPIAAAAAAVESPALDSKHVFTATTNGHSANGIDAAADLPPNSATKPAGSAVTPKSPMQTFTFPKKTSSNDTTPGSGSGSSGSDTDNLLSPNSAATAATTTPKSPISAAASPGNGLTLGRQSMHRRVGSQNNETNRSAAMQRARETPLTEDEEKQVTALLPLTRTERLGPFFAFVQGLARRKWWFCLDKYLLMILQANDSVSDAVLRNWKAWLFPLMQSSSGTLMEKHAEKQLLSIVTLLISRVHFAHFARAVAVTANPEATAAAPGSGGNAATAALAAVVAKAGTAAAALTGALLNTDSSKSDKEKAEKEKELPPIAVLLKNLVDDLVAFAWNDDMCKVIRLILRSFLNLVAAMVKENSLWRHNPAHPAWQRLFACLDVIEDFIFFRPIRSAKIELHLNDRGALDLRIVKPVMAILNGLNVDNLTPGDVSPESAKLCKAVKEQATGERNFYALLQTYLESICSVAKTMPATPGVDTKADDASKLAHSAMVSAAQSLQKVMLKRKRFASFWSTNTDLKAMFDGIVPALRQLRNSRAIRPAAQFASSQDHNGLAEGGSGGGAARSDAVSFETSDELKKEDFEALVKQCEAREPIGVGSFGCVWKVRFHDLDWACKIITIPEGAVNAGANEATIRAEIRVHRKLRAMRAVMFRGAYTVPPHIMILTEYCPKTLADCIRPKKSARTSTTALSGNGALPTTKEDDAATATAAGSPASGLGGEEKQHKTDSKSSDSVKSTGSHGSSGEEWVPLTLEKRLQYAKAIAEGLGELHHQNPPIVHRDLKPQNVLIDAHDNVKLCDFGMSHLASASSVSETMNSLVVKARSNAGTPLYKAPESWEDDRPSGTASDVYSFAMLLHELFTGKSPWEGKSMINLASAHAKRKDAPIDPDLVKQHPKVAALVKRCAAYDEKDRPNTTAILSALKVLFAEYGIEQDAE